jgi:hypothetical protein
MRIIEEYASPTELTPWQLEDQIDTFHRIERDWKRQGQPLAHIERLVQLRKCYQYELRTAVFVDRVLERLETA